MTPEPDYGMRRCFGYFSAFWYSADDIKKEAIELIRKWLLGLLALPLIMAVMLSGVYAHWDDAVRINGYVSTGVFNIELSLGKYGDIEDDSGYNYDVGQIEVTLADENDGDDVYDGGIKDKLWVNITNMYPDYYAWFEFNIDNTGTIPAYIQANLTNFSPEICENATYFSLEIRFDDVLVYQWIGDGMGGGSENYNDTFGYVDDNTFYFNDILEPGEAWYFTIHIDMISEPNPPEELMDQEYIFEVEILGIQAVP